MVVSKFQQKRPTVSVVIPTYNRAHVLPNAISSVLTQTFRDFEIIIVDDGSTDQTQELLRNHSAPITIIRQENQGVSAARNAGILASRGEYVAFLDSDDEWLRNKLESQVGFLILNHKVDFVSCLAVNESAAPFRRMRPKARQQFFDALSYPFPSNVSRFVVRRSCFERHGLFDVSLNGPEDRDLWLRFLYRGSRMDMIHQPLIKYAFSPDALSGNALVMLRGETEIKRRYIDTLASPWQRWWIGTRFQARSYFSAAINFRVNGDLASYHRFLRRSLMTNPFAPRTNDRFRCLLKTFLSPY